VIADAERGATGAGYRATTAFSLLLLRCGKVTAIKFFDGAEFDQVKLDAILAVQSSEAEDAEVHEDSAGLIYRYSQRLD